ncbi:MAG: ribose-5-phosphate isomerase RpiA [Deinococcota bacterium]
MKTDDLKRAAAEKAARHVQPGMRLGLGSGSTAKHAIDAIGERFQKGELAGIQAVATSNASDAQARALGIPMMPFEGGLDLAIDGMDELTPQLDAIKGLGGALTREKIVEARVDLLILIADDSKKVTKLGEKAPLPIEVIPLAQTVVTRELEHLGATITLREVDGEPFITDNQNIILDCRWQSWQPHELAPIITAIPGVVEHGLFLGMAKLAYLASEGGVLELEPRETWS